jgi:hypothetical protein
MVAGDRLVFEDHGGDMDRVRADFGTGRDGIVPRLETRNGGHDDIKWNRPRRGIIRGGTGSKVIFRG